MIRIHNITVSIAIANYCITFYFNLVVVISSDVSRSSFTILYVNDITKVSNIFKINLFADDTSLIHTHDNFEYLIKETNDELIRISTWLATNKLVLNINKTNYMIFTSRGKSYNKNVTNIKIDGNNIQQVNKTKFLGIIIEEHAKLGDAHLPSMQYNCKKCWHSSKVTIFCSGLCIENVIPFFNIIAPSILHIIMGKFILLTFTKAKAITKESYTNHIKCQIILPIPVRYFLT